MTMISTITRWSDEKEAGKNLLGYALGAAGGIISLGDEEIDSIHIFMPAMPQNQDILRFQGKDIYEITDGIKQIKPSVNIIVHSYTQEENDRSDHTTNPP